MLRQHHPALGALVASSPHLVYCWRKGTLKCVNINLIGRKQGARALIGREGFREANQNTECIHDSQWEAIFCSQPIRRPKTVAKGRAGTPPGLHRSRLILSSHPRVWPMAPSPACETPNKQMTEIGLILSHLWKNTRKKCIFFTIFVTCNIEHTHNTVTSLSKYDSMCILDRMSLYKDSETNSFTNGYVTENDNGALHNESGQIVCIVK